jgi:hypothetical protein
MLLKLCVVALCVMTNNNDITCLVFHVSEFSAPQSYLALQEPPSPGPINRIARGQVT